MNRLPFSFTVMILISLFGPPAAVVRGQDGTAPPGPPVIRTHGEAVLTVEPDLAELQIGVVTEGPNAQTAARNNAARADAVLKALRELLGRDAEIKTVGYSINPVYSNPRSGKSGITHYAASNLIRVKTHELKRVGEIIDRANEAGANTVRGLQFSLKDDAAARRNALDQAAREARAKADAMAAALGVKIKRILQAEETFEGPRPYAGNLRFAEAALSSAATPVETGTLEIQAAVMLTVEVTP